MEEFAKILSEDLERTSQSHEYQFVSPKVAEDLAKNVGKAKTLEKKTKEAKPTVKSQPKKIVKFKDKKARKKKGFIERIKAKIDAKKTMAMRREIDCAMKYTNTIKEICQDELDLNSNLIKDKKLRDKIDYFKTSDDNNLKDISAIKEELLAKRKEQINSLREALEMIQTAKIRKELANERWLTDEQIDYLLGGETVLETDGLIKRTLAPLGRIGVKEDGSLSISNKIPLKADDIRGTKLEDELKRYSTMPKVSELTDEEIIQLAKSIRIKDGNIRVNFQYLYDGKTPGDLSWIAKDVPIDGYTHTENKGRLGVRLNFFKNLYGQDFYVNGLENVLPNANKGFEDIGMYDKIIVELEKMEKLEKVKMLENQMLLLDDRASDLEETQNLTKKDKKSRKQLRKIAESKVLQLKAQDVEITDEISKNKMYESSILAKAVGALDLTPVIKDKSRKIDKLKSQDEK